MRLVWISIVAALVLVGAYVAAGGADYKPSEVRDPCERRQWREPANLDELGQQLALSGIDGAACDLGVTREALARALATDEDRAEFMQDNSISDEEFDAAVRAGLDRMVDDAEAAGEIGGFVAAGLRALIRVVPAGEAFELLMDARPLLERVLGTGSELGIPGLGGEAGGEGGSGRGLGERLREGLEGLGMERPDSELGKAVDEGLGQLRRGLDSLRQSLDSDR